MFVKMLCTVAVMFAYALPGFIFIKVKAIKEEHISSFAKFLLYVCHPCLFLYSFNEATFTMETLKYMGIFFAVCISMQIVIVLCVALCFKNSFDNVRKRICSIASALANVGFFGIPLLESLLPDYPMAILFSTVFSVSLNILSWTLAVGIISWDKSKISVKRMVITPTTVVLAIALPLFFTGAKLPTLLGDSVKLLGRMTTPLCMLIMGMRLATVRPKDLFTDKFVYISCFVKNVIYPLLSFAIALVLPLPQYLKVTFFILGCCPTASMVLNLSELIGKGQKSAANSMLISTLLCIATVPLFTLMVPLL